MNKEVPYEFLPKEYFEHATQPGNIELVYPEFIKRRQAYQEALESGDEFKAAEAEQSLRSFLIEMQHLHAEHGDQFTKAEWDLIMEAEELNRGLHSPVGDVERTYPATEAYDIGNPAKERLLISAEIEEVEKELETARADKIPDLKNRLVELRQEYKLLDPNTSADQLQNSLKN